MTTTFGDVIRAVAVGDAWGDPTEFRRIADITKNDKRGPELPQRLRITDDTQMSLYLASALDEAGPDATVKQTQDAIIAAFLEYYDDPDTPSRAPGGTVMGSLGRIDRGKSWQQGTNKTSDGSGTVMRTSPTAFLSEDRWVGVTAFAAAVTHGAANAIAAAILDVAVLRRIMAGKAAPGQLVREALIMADHAQEYGLLDVGEWIDGYEVPGGLQSGFDELARLLKEALNVLPSLQADPWALESDPSDQEFFQAGYQGAGWRGHHTLVVALMAIDMIPNDPWDALRRAAVTTGDSDTIGAVAGALLAASGLRIYPSTFVRLEQRYQNWIEEADSYVFVAEPVVTPKRGFFSRLFGRRG